MLPTWYNIYKEKIESSINSYLKEYFKFEDNKWLKVIEEATIYACNWWKRIRAILALEFYLIFSWRDINDISENDNIIKFCIALELLHAYSLVHDDLPCIDNDILRRWELTVWKKYGEDNAILVWDLLNLLSFKSISEIWESTIINHFLKSIWISWMLWWQTLDLYYENNPKQLTLDNLIETHNKKTWEFIKMSILGWLIIAEKELNSSKNKKIKDIKKYLDFWEKIGLAFQLKDDLLDIEWTSKETGKSVWSEDKGFVYFIWIEKTHLYLDDLLKDCIEIISDLKSDKLNFLVNYIWNRKK